MSTRPFRLSPTTPARSIRHPGLVSAWNMASAAAVGVLLSLTCLPAVAQTPAQTQSPATTTAPVAAAINAPVSPTSAPAASAHTDSHQAERAAHREAWQQKRAARHAERLAKLHQRLALTSTQEVAWSSFEQAMQLPQRRATAERGERSSWKNLTAPERVDRMRDMRTQRAAAMDARGDATKAFYAQLEPTQQTTFDQASRSLMRHGHRHGQGGRMHSPRSES